MNNFVKYKIIVNGTIVANIADIDTKSYQLNITGILLNEYPFYNLTIVTETTTSNISDTKWFYIDQTNPTIFISTPANNTITYNPIVYVQWAGNDVGVGISHFIVKINDQFFERTCYEKNYVYLILEPIDGIYSIKVEAFDKASNTEQSIISLEVFVALPDFSANIPSIFYTQTGEFQLNVSIINPQSGVRKIRITLDNEEIKSYDYETAIQYSSFTTPSIQINASNYDTLFGTHSLAIYVVDYYKRESKQIYVINVDNELPEFVGSISIGTHVFNGDILEFTEGEVTQLLIIVSVSDNFDIKGVFLNIYGLGINNTLEFEEHLSRDITKEYQLTLNISGLDIGDYQLSFTAIDKAGNLITVSYNITIIAQTIVPWLFQGANLYYFSFGMLLTALFISGLIVIVRASYLNRNWQQEIIAVIYVKKTGLTCTYVPYLPKLIQEEQLIGGAMIAVQGVLEEITHEEKRRTIETMELGNKSLLVILGEFGISVVIVQKVKPIHKEKLKNFTKEFEKIYQDPLEALYFVDSESFNESTKLVEKYFGALDSPERFSKLNITEQLSSVQKENDSLNQFNIVKDSSVASPKTPIDELMRNVSKEAKRSLLKVIKIAPEVIIALTEKDIELSEELVNNLIIEIELLIKIERKNEDLRELIQTLLSFTEEAQSGIKACREENLRMLELAIEQTSQLWFSEIAEKWSNVQ